METAELNITAFMNLMVILVPFLLITAVFSRLAILELNLPGSSTEPVEPQEQTSSWRSSFAMTRLKSATVTRACSVSIRTPRRGEYDYEALERQARRAQGALSEKTDASILLERRSPTTRSCR